MKRTKTLSALLSFPSVGAGWPRAITHPRLPQIRTCALTHTVPQSMESLRGVHGVDHRGARERVPL